MEPRTGLDLELVAASEYLSEWDRSNKKGTGRRTEQQ
jgi:hypothetical protein